MASREGWLKEENRMKRKHEQDGESIGWKEGVGSRNRERGDQRREKFRRVCVRVRVRVGKTGRETKGAPKFPSSLEEGLSARSLYDPRVVAGARLRGRCFRVTRTTPKKCVCACVAAWFNCRPCCRLAFSSRDHERGILPVEYF